MAPRYLVLQTAFLGDVVLALPVAQRLRQMVPGAEVHWVVRRGSEGLLANHPAAQHVHVWDKRRKYASLAALVGTLRRQHYAAAFNCQRFFTSGLLTVLSGARVLVGFAKNPLSAAFTHRLPHQIPSAALLREGSVAPPLAAAPTHEVDRNLTLLHPLFPHSAALPRERPRLYPSPTDEARVAALRTGRPYVVVAPASVWFTKQWPAAQWRRMLAALPAGLDVFLVGAPHERALCADLAAGLPQVRNLAGTLSLLQTAALMAGARRVFANDSAPLHLASAVNAPTTAVFCNTVPAFGFGPLADDAVVCQVPNLYCRPCHLTGRRACPEGHFRCALDINAAAVAATVA